MEKQLDDASAAALSGQTDGNSGLEYPSTAQENLWGVETFRLVNHLLNCFSPAGELRVYPVAGNPDAVGIRAGRRRLGNDVLVYAGADPAIDGLTDDDVTYIWADDVAGTLAIGSGIDADDWPNRPHWRLAAVTMVDGVITSIADRRGEEVVGIVAQDFAAADRPLATQCRGLIIINNDTGALNYSDGSAWKNYDGSLA